MDRRPTLEARPPALIDRVVRVLVPAPCREHVIGDLWERYRSPGAYLLDALQTIPFVVVSQVRRTSPLPAIVIQTFVVTVPLLAGTGLRRTAAPALVLTALVTIVLRDAYKRCASVSAMQVATDVGIAATAMVLCETIVAVVRPSLLVPWRAMVASIVGFGMLFLLRLQNPGLGAHVRRLTSATPLTLDALTTEVRLFERTCRRAIRIETIAGVAIAIGFIVPLLFAPNWILRVGWALGSAYGLYVAAFMITHPLKPTPEGLDLHSLSSFHRHQLENRVSLLETMWRWYFLPGAPAMILIIIGSATLAAERVRPMWPAAIVVAALMCVAVAGLSGARRSARKLRVRIDALNRGGSTDGPGEP